MVSEPQIERGFPYVGAPGWLTKLHQFCIRSMPQRIEPDWLTATDRLGLSHSNARQLLSFMQKIGWIQNDGTVTSDGRKLRLVGEPWKEAMRGMVEKIYADLLNQIKSQDEFTPREVEEFFVAATNIGHSGRQQMIAVFRWFLREAQHAEFEQKIWGTVQRRAQRPTDDRREKPKQNASARRKKTEQRAEAPAEGDVPAPENGSAADPRLSAIASVLKINIDGTWQEDRIEAVFQMLDKLLKGEPINGGIRST